MSNILSRISMATKVQQMFLEGTECCIVYKTPIPESSLAAIALENIFFIEQGNKAKRMRNLPMEKQSLLYQFLS